jgi:hypothetical protein
MTASELIERADALYPNVYPFTLKARWLYGLDKTICSELLSRYGNEPLLRECEMLSACRELILAEEFSDVYISYLTMKMELHSGNITGYVNAASLYNSAYLSFMNHYNRTHRCQGAVIKID